MTPLRPLTGPSLALIPLFLAACSGGDSAKLDDTSGTGDTADSADSADSGDTADSADSGDSDTSTDTDTGSAGAALVVLNEIVSSNKTSAYDETGAAADWIELYNAGDAAADLTGWSIIDDPTKTPWPFPDGTTIEVGGYLVLWADSDETDGPLHTNFRLTAVGESLYLYDDAGATADSVDFPALTADQAYARIPDGTDTWTTTSHATPEAANHS